MTAYDRPGAAEGRSLHRFAVLLKEVPSSEKNIAVWGRVIAGMDAVMPMPAEDSPAVLEAVQFASDMPETARPRAWVQRTDSRAFLAQRHGAAGPCDLPPVDAIISE